MTVILSDNINIDKETKDWADEIMDMVEAETLGNFNRGDSLKKGIRVFLEGKLSDIIWDLEKLVKNDN